MVLCLLASTCLAMAPPAQQPLRIGTISVRTLGVFTDQEAARGWPYRIAALLHVHSRESTIRSALLFREGDLFEPEKLSESERNLRQMHFLRSASVVPRPPRNGVVDVDVVTQDTWTTEPSVSLARRGGTATFGMSLLERNLLGTGREIQFLYDHGADRISRSFSFSDPNLFGPYRRGYILHSSNSDGTEDEGFFERPFSGVETPRAGSVRWQITQEDRKLYRDGSESGLLRRDHREFHAELGGAFDPNPYAARRLGFGVSWIRDHVRETKAVPDSTAPATPPGAVIRAGTPPPGRREYRYVFAHTEFLRSNFLKLDYLDNGPRIEDVELGPHASLYTGISPRFFGAPRTTGWLKLTASRGLHAGSGAYLLAQGTAETRLGPERGNTQVTSDLRFVRRSGDRFPRTFVARAAFNRGWHLDPEVQFFADGTNGLRAFKLHAYEGDRVFLFNLEERVFTRALFLQVVSPGAAVFFDAGTAVPAGIGLHRALVRSDAGIGLRLGLPRASAHTVVRVDLGFPLNRDPDGRRRPLLSFSSSQAF